MNIYLLRVSVFGSVLIVLLVSLSSTSNLAEELIHSVEDTTCIDGVQSGDMTLFQV